MKTAIGQKLVTKIESLLPMTFGSFVLFVLIIYFLYIVSKTTWGNYNFNQEISEQQAKVAEIESELEFMQHRINYYQTNSFKEKEAREKLGYRAPDEQAMSLPLDQPEDKVVDQAVGEVKIKSPNYWLWWRYYFN